MAKCMEEQKFKPVSPVTAQIVEDLAKNKFVEIMVMNITHKSRIKGDLEDLTQIIYIALLEMESEKLARMIECHELNFFVARMITNQYFSVTSPFYKENRKFRESSCDVSPQISDSMADSADRLARLI